MGQGFWILTWDNWGAGLNMVNPRLVTRENGDNWFSYDSPDQRRNLINIYTSGLKYFKVLE